MSTNFLMNPVKFIREKRSIRRQRRMAVKMLALSGILRSANHGIRYAMSDKDLNRFLSEPEV